MAGRPSVHVLLPQVGTALLAGGMLAFALSFDEIIVTIFTSGHEKTLPIWFFNELFRPRDRPITNVVAVIVIAVTLVPIVLAYYLTRPAEERPMNTKLLINGKLVTGAGRRKTCSIPPRAKSSRRSARHPKGRSTRRQRRGRRFPVVRHGAEGSRGPAAEARGSHRSGRGGLRALESQNCGKPYNAVLNDEIPAIADVFRFFAGAARTMHGALAGEYLPGSRA